MVPEPVRQAVGRGRGWDVLEERMHSPFQVLDASAIEGTRWLAGESSSISIYLLEERMAGGGGGVGMY